MTDRATERREQVAFRYWNSPAFRARLDTERPAALPAREQALARVTARSYIASKLNIAARALRAPFFDDADREVSLTVAAQSLAAARSMRSTMPDSGLPQ